MKPTSDDDGGGDIATASLCNRFAGANKYLTVSRFLTGDRPNQKQALNSFQTKLRMG
jgi:hypothetical protein